MTPRAALSPSAKVGITTVAVLIVVIMVARFFNWLDFNKPQGYNLQFHFDSIRGLKTGAAVVFNGRPIGEVVSWEPADDQGTKVLVQLNDTSQRIHSNATAYITMESVLGNKLISIEEPLSGIRNVEPNVKTWPNPAMPEYEIRRGTLKPGDPVYRQFTDGRERIGVVEKVAPYSQEFSMATFRMDEGKSIGFEEAMVPGYGLDSAARTVAVVYPPVEPGGYIVGRKEPEATDILVSVNEVILEVNRLIHVLGPEIQEITEHLDEVLLSVDSILDKEQIDALFASLQRELADTGHAIDAISGEISGILRESRPVLMETLASAQRATTSVEKITAEMEGLVNDEETRAKLQSMLTELEASSKALTRVMEDIESMTGDEQMQADIKATVKVARSTMEQADATLTRVSKTADDLGGFEIGGHIRERYNTDNERAYTDARLWVDKPGEFRIHAGVSDIGEGSHFDLGYGHYLTPEGLLYGGVYRGKVGVGGEYRFDPFTLSADFYDANDPTLDLFGAWKFNQSFSLLAGIEDVLDEDTTQFNVGAQLNF